MGAYSIGKNQYGVAYRIPLTGRYRRREAVVLPDAIRDLLTAEGRLQRAVEYALHSNNLDLPPNLGRPSSAFLLCFEENGRRKTSVDFFLTRYYDDSRSQPHDYLRDVGGYSHAKNIISIDGRSVTSGHLGPLTISTPEAAYLLLLDTFCGASSYEHISPDMRMIIDQLYGNRIVPFTSDGFPI